MVNTRKIVSCKQRSTFDSILIVLFYKYYGNAMIYLVIRYKHEFARINCMLVFSYFLHSLDYIYTKMENNMKMNDENQYL